MSVIKPLDFAIEQYYESLPENLRKFSPQSYSEFDARINKLASLSSIWKTDKAEYICLAKAIQVIQKKIDNQSLFYVQRDKTICLSGADYFVEREISYTFDNYGLTYLEELKTKCLKITHLIRFFDFHLGSCHEHRLFDSLRDSTIQRVRYQLPYEIPAKQTIVVVIDTDQNADDLYATEFCYNTYINNGPNFKWKSIGIPIGPRRIYEKATHLQILSKETLESGEIVITKLHESIPETLVNRILSFMKSGRMSNEFDCGHFAYYMHSTIATRVAKQFTSEEELIPGDLVCLVDKNAKEFENPWDCVLDHMVHMAIYVGNNIYLSLYGKTGPLRTASLDAMEKTYSKTIDKVVISYSQS